MKTRSLLPALLVMVLLNACGQQKPSRPAQRPTAATTERAAPPEGLPYSAEAARPSPPSPSKPSAATRPAAPATVVTVNGRPITRARFQQALEAANGARILDQLITEMLVDEELARHKLSVPDALIDARLTRTLERFGLRGPRASALLQMPGARERFRTQVADMLKLGRLLFGDADLKRFYAQHKKDLFKNQSYDKAQDDVWEALFRQKSQEGEPQKLLARLKRQAKLSFGDPRYAFLAKEYREASASRPPSPVRPMPPRIRPVTPPPPPSPPAPTPPAPPAPSAPSAPPAPAAPPPPAPGNP